MPGFLPDGTPIDAPFDQDGQNVARLPDGTVIYDSTPYESGAYQKARQAAAGVNEAVGGMLSPLDRMAEASRAPGQETIYDAFPQLPGGDRMRDYAPGGNVEQMIAGAGNVPPPATAGERIARRTGQELAATAPFAAGAMGLASRAALGPTMGAPGNAIAEAGRSYLRGIANTPGRAAAGELAAATGAGIGAGVAGELDPGDQTSEMIGQLAGGVVPAALAQTPGAWLVRGAGAAARRVSPQARQQAARRAVSDAIGGEMTPEAQAGIAQADRLRQDIPGFNPSLAEATGSPPIVATQRAIEAQARGAKRAGYDARRAGNAAAVGRYQAEQAPAGEPDAEFVVDAVQGRVERLRGRIADEQRLLDAQRQGLAGGLPGNRQAAGANLRDVMGQMREATSAEMSDLARRTVGPYYDVELRIDDLHDTLLNQFGPKGPFDDPNRIPDILQDLYRYGQTGELASVPRGHWLNEALHPGNRPNAAPLAGQNSLPPVRFEDLKVLRERVGDELRDATASATPNRAKIRTLVQLREALDGGMDELMQRQAPEAMEAWLSFRQAYKQQYIDRFEQGATFKVRQKDGRAYYRTPDEEVGKAFFHPGGDQAADQFLRTFGDDPRAQRALADYALDDLANAAVRDGVLNPRLAAAWERRHASVLERLPFVRQAVADMQTADAALRARQATLTARERRIGDQMLVRQIDRVSNGAAAPEQVIDQALQNPRAMSKLWAATRQDDTARAALKRNVWERVSTGSADDVQRSLDQYGPQLKLLLGGRHIEALNTIQAARSMMEAVPPSGARAFSANPVQALEDTMGMGASAAASRYVNVQSGRLSGRIAAFDAFGRFMRARTLAQQQALFKEALYDPDVARSLADMVTIGRLPRDEARRLNARLFALGMEPTSHDE